MSEHRLGNNSSLALKKRKKNPHRTVCVKLHAVSCIFSLHIKASVNKTKNKDTVTTQR